MPACDVVEPNSQSPMHTSKFIFLWQTLFAPVDEKILSICFVTNVFDY